MEIPSKANLILVPGPIGNLADITLRALQVLASVDSVLAEDTRTSGVLLKHHSISKPIIAYHNFNEHHVTPVLIQRMQNGERFALLSDAGTPGISDPGFLIVRETLKAGLQVECLPGPTALIPALVKSGFATDRFTFEGFLPHKKGRQTALKNLATEQRTMIFYESPHRLVKCLTQFAEYLGPDRRVSVSRELTKLYEETRTGTVTEVLAHFEKTEPRGEIVIVVEGFNPKQADE